ncbi:MAG: D-cysteine desulfhydrase family protein [Gammaproteobacteria bacterium]|nr:D-cysteine desulfhydrase family protein [Gammaproteobacteria bacterium]MDH3450038.1 D-cysteine desulfhydrase family protein [Gammaproteobacteria bacterium]
MSLTQKFPRVELSHLPTPLELLNNVSAEFDTNVWIKRDDCTGLAFGGNKSRQLEFYIGQALEQGADTLLTTGAVQSNHVRMTVAAARKMGLEVEVQLEHRVDRNQPEYHQSGNPYLVRLMGAKIHYYPEGEDEAGADLALERRASELERQGRKAYVIPLSNAHTPYGALGYVDCGEELMSQLNRREIEPTRFIVPSGSASTHTGFLLGVRACGCHAPVHGVCVRRDAQSQKQRVATKLRAVIDTIGSDIDIPDAEIFCDDSMLAPGYGLPNEDTVAAIKYLARREGILLDPTYSGKTFAVLLKLLQGGNYRAQDNLVFLHTGGAASLFAYPELVEQA